MKLKCNVCKESPTVELPEPQFDGEGFYCPACDKTLALASEDEIVGNIYWTPIDTGFNKEWGGCPVTIIEN